jgi:dipeptidyl aminopeptidase/acylaminoacyl peptidase
VHSCADTSAARIPVWSRPVPASPKQLVHRQVALGELALSPGGSLLAYTRRTVAGNDYETHLWLVPLAGGRPRQLTRGTVKDAGPQFTADGRRLAFLRDEQVWILDVDGGEAEPLAKLEHGLSAFRLSPDGRRIALLGGAPEPRLAVGELPDSGPPLARRILRIDWRYDGSGILDRHDHLFVAAARPGARARQVTTGDWSVRGFDWSPEGEQLVFAADLAGDADVRDRPSLYLVSASGGDPAELCALPGLCRTPAWSPDGRHVAFRGVAAHGAPEDAHVGIYVVPAGGGEPRDLAEGLDVAPQVTFGSDLEDWKLDGGTDLTWDGAGAVLCPVNAGGSCALWRFPLHGGDPGPVEDTPLHLCRYAAAGGQLAILGADGLAPPELHRLGPRPRRLTRDGRWLSQLANLEQEMGDVPGPAGPIRTWITSPAGSAGQRLPTVLEIHGGPTGTHSPLPWLPAIALAAAGLRVLRPDPRGSEGYGSDWIAALLGRWGEVDAEDCLAVVDWAVSSGRSDPDRLGVWGLSYGGFLTQWLITQTTRFRAAVAMNGVTNQVAAALSCDLGVPFLTRLGWQPFPQSADTLWRQSPLAFVDRVETPLLLLQGQGDLRCPASDNEQLFVALRALGREVEYLLYPEETHIMAAIGRPDRRVDMMERTLAWFAGHGVG